MVATCSLLYPQQLLLPISVLKHTALQIPHIPNYRCTFRTLGRQSSLQLLCLFLGSAHRGAAVRENLVFLTVTTVFLHVGRDTWPCGPRWCTVRCRQTVNCSCD